MKEKRLAKSILATIVSALPLLDANASYKPAYAIADPEAPIRKIVESIQPTHRSNLPSTAQGVYYPSSGIGFYDQDLPGREGTNTALHEIGHAFGLRDEYQTDLFMANQPGGGSFDFVRGLGYKPPIR